MPWLAVFPKLVTQGLQRFWSVLALRSLDHVQADVFACFIQPEYPENLYLYERRLHIQKQKALRAINRLRKIDSHRANQLEALFDILMDAAQLRRRVTDHTVFRLCSNELSAISSMLGVVFHELIAIIRKKQTTIDTVALEENINHLEQTFVSVMSVTAREPLAIILFISSLKMLRKKMEAFCDALS